jgi:Tol biopolymer transport system component
VGQVLSEGGVVNAPEISPDGRYVAYDRFSGGNRDVWILDLERGGSTRATTDLAVDGFPVWSPDGGRIAFHSQRDGTFDVWVKQANGAAGSEVRLHGGAGHEWPLDWSDDGRFVLYRSTDANYAASDLWALPMTGDDRTPIAVARTRFEERTGEISPDGRWVAYETDESGRSEIVLQAFPSPSAIVPVSTGGGVAPRWSRDGATIHFVAPDGRMMAAPVSPNAAALEPGVPVALFPMHVTSQVFKFQYAVARDGRFLVNNRQVEGDAVTPITVLLNWAP